MSQTTTCSQCGGEIEFGMYPFCPHGYALGREPRQFQPIVVHRKLMADGQYAYEYPGHSSDAVPAGYEKVELSTLAQADRFVKDRQQEEQELRTMQIRGERDYWNNRVRERRENSRIELQKRLGKSHSLIGDRIAKLIDERRERKFQDLERKSVNFHSQVLSYDSGHRPEYREEGKRKISVVVNRSDH